MSQERISSEEYRRRVGAPVAEKPQIRLPIASVPNRTEAEYGMILRDEFPTFKIRYEAITFRLPSGTRYSPDWTVWNEGTLRLVVETKGAHIHSSASIRAFKEARAAWPSIPFRFAQKMKSGWQIAE